jgi:TRAP-type C4-dicarboxylate transport system substrate-binding protein
VARRIGNKLGKGSNKKMRYMNWKNCRRHFSIGATLILGSLALLIAGTAQSQETHLNFTGDNSKQPYAKIYKEVLLKEVPKKYGGTVKFSLTFTNDLGVSSFQTLNLVRAGVLEVAHIKPAQVAAEIRMLEGLDLPGAFDGLEKAASVMIAAEPLLRDELKAMKAYYLGYIAIVPQYIWCKPKIAGLKDLKGKRVRTFTRPQADFIKAVGAEPVSIAFAEVYVALERGVVDCAVTGPTAGNRLHWYEVTNYLYAVPISVPPNAIVANLDVWQGLSKKVQDAVQATVKTIQDRQLKSELALWSDSLSCNTGGPCKFGNRGKMTLVKPVPQDLKFRKEVLASVILPGFIKRCGAKCVDKWDTWIGKHIGMSAKGTAR